MWTGGTAATRPAGGLDRPRSLPLPDAESADGSPESNVRYILKK